MNTIVLKLFSTAGELTQRELERALKCACEDLTLDIQDALARGDMERVTHLASDLAEAAAAQLMAFDKAELQDALLEAYRREHAGQ